MTLDLALFLCAAIISLAASVLLVSRLERMAHRAGIDGIALGMMVALAANMPEIVSAATAMLRHHADVGVGVVFGSNVFNIAALLGLGAAVAGGVTFHRRALVLSGSVAVFVAVASLGVILQEWDVTAVSVIVFAGLFMYVALAVTPARKIPLPKAAREWLSIAVAEEEQEVAGLVVVQSARRSDVIQAVVSLGIVVAASVVMEHSAYSVGLRHGVPDIVIGAIVLAVVTSLPNVVGAVYLAKRGQATALLSEALNSNSLNVLVGFLISGAVIGLGVTTGVERTVVVWYAAYTLLVLALAYVRHGIGRWTGVGIIACYLVFIIDIVGSSPG